MLLPGDWVEVLPPSGIHRTLDVDQALDGLPFMPEMLPSCGRRYRVAMRAERTCVHPPQFPFRRLERTVVLEGLRCDGSSHGGCQLGCMLFWKEAWVRRVDADGAASGAGDSEPAPVLRSTRASAPETYFCQATELPKATSPGDPLWRPGQYVGFLRSRTFTPRQLVAMFAGPARRRVDRFVGTLTGRRLLRDMPGPTTLDLRPGDWVEVRARDEILHTLDANRSLRGLAFGGDMWSQCGARARVLRRVDRLMQEHTGVVRPVRDMVVLDGLACDRYFGCARGMPFLWREEWLRRVDGPGCTRGPAASASDSP